MDPVKKYKRMAFHQANKANRSHGGLLDIARLESAGMEGMSKALASYDPAYGASLGTWIFYSVRQTIQVEVKKQRKALAEMVVVGQDDDQLCILDTLGADSDVEDRINRIQLHDLLLRQIVKLPKKQQRLMIAMLSQGMTQIEYGESEGESRKAISALYCSAIATLHKWMIRSRSEVVFA